MAKFGSFKNVVVDKTFSMRQGLAQSRKSLYWALLNLFFACILYSDLLYHQVGIFGSFDNVFIKTAEYVVAGVLTLNILVDVFKYVKPRFISNQVELNPEQMRLLRVRQSETGFKLTSADAGKLLQEDNSMIFNTSACSGMSGYTSGSSCASPVSGHSTPAWIQSPFSMRNISFSPDLSRTYSPTSLNNTFSSSINNSTSLRNHSSISPSVSPWATGDLTPAGLRARHLGTPLSRSPASPVDRIADPQSLNKYLKEQEEKQYKTYLTSDQSNTSGGSFWSFNRSASDFTRVLSRYDYQIASRSPQSFTADERDEGPMIGMEMWLKYDITEDTVMLWIEKLREWLCTTIVARVSKEIRVVNKRLARIGCEDMQIGEVSASTLKQLAFTKSLHVPTLHALVPYLEISANQTYVVKRLHHLAKGGCMSDYDWNGGGVYGKPWSETLPNDATLLAHQFCTYMDSRLPADAKYPDGKTFTSHYFLKTPDKPNLTKGDNLLLYQSKIHPPHFNLVIGSDVWPVQKGRNNLFNALLLFLYHIKTKEHGMLGRVNLGLSGVNMLHILEPKAGTYDPTITSLRADGSPGRLLVI